ncbi:hypothetical protein [Microbacterium sp. LWH3-1.2]|uniref:hypothetical protein n=1 Tax=Microbacterium sp. LWH3-1.2 TaxID=3135256 RepID=UPI00342728EF
MAPEQRCPRPPRRPTPLLLALLGVMEMVTPTPTSRWRPDRERLVRARVARVSVRADH